MIVNDKNEVIACRLLPRDIGEEVFAPGGPFQPCLMFLGKAGASLDCTTILAQCYKTFYASS